MYRQIVRLSLVLALIDLVMEHLNYRSRHSEFIVHISSKLVDFSIVQIEEIITWQLFAVCCF